MMRSFLRKKGRRRGRYRLLGVAALLFAVAGAAAGFPVSVRDDRGVEVHIRTRPERVIVLAALYAEIVVSLGAERMLVGSAESPDNPPEMGAVPSVGPSLAPSLEAILALQPDLVLGGWGDVRSGLERLGIVVVTVGQPGGFISSVGDVLQAIRTVGQAIGFAREAEELSCAIALRILETEARVLSRPAVSAVVLFISGPDSPPYVIGAGSVEHELLVRAGGRNAFADVAGFRPISVEELLVRDPDVIFTDPSQTGYLISSRHLAGLTAVREGRVFGIRAAEMTSTRVDRALEEMASRLHPDVFGPG